MQLAADKTQGKKQTKLQKKHALGGKERGASVCFVLFGFDRGCLDGASLGK